MSVQRAMRATVRVRLVSVALLLPVATVLAACGSVKLPEEHFYRLDVPRQAGTAAAPSVEMRPLVVRVQRLQLGADLAGDRLMVGAGAVRLQPYVFHRWAGSLDSLVTDAFVTAFARSGAFGAVKGPDDAGGEDVTVSGRILDFHQVQENGAPAALVTLDLVVARGEQPVWRSELRRLEPAQGSEPEAVVRALSAGLAHVLHDAVERCRAAAAASSGDAADVGATVEAGPAK